MRVFITVKTYPTLSATYRELVCTAGLSDDGKWIRIYPIPFRRMDYDQRYKKYQWVNLDIARNTSDPRPESHRPTNIEAMQLLDEVDTENGTWATRRRLVLNVVHTNLGALIEQAKNTEIATSLATFKPQEILAFEYEATDREWDKDKLQQLNQLDLFDNAENPFEVVNKLPYKFFYKFLDDQGMESRMMIEDWEIGMLFWNCLARHDGDEIRACEEVKRKYFDDFALTKDLHFFLGTTRQYHFVAPNPFLIIGTFHPPAEVQTELDLT